MGDDEKDYLYSTVAANISKLIHRGALQCGQKMPSIREMSAQLGVSISTVLHAYSILEAQSQIESRPRSGYFVSHLAVGERTKPRIEKVSDMAKPIEIIDFIGEIFKSDSMPGTIPFGLALPDPSLLPIKLLNQTSAKICRDNPGAGASYDSILGNTNLRKQLSLRSIRWGLSLSPEDIIITTGAIEALSLSLRAVAKPGDTIAIESPTYFGILQILEGLGMKAIEIPCDPATGLDLEALESMLKKKKIQACVTIPNFQNPSGSTMPDEHKKRLVTLVTQYGLPLIEDDIYSDLYFGKRRPLTLKSFDKEGFVILCSSISKSLAPGYRIGWIVPGRYKRKVEILKSVISGRTNSLSQIAVAEFMRIGAFDKHLKSLRPQLRQQMAIARKSILKTFPAGTRVSEPEGGFVLWVEGPPYLDSLQLQQEALSAGISLAPGPIFSARKGYRNYFRVSCGHIWNNHSDVAIKKLAEIMKEASHNS